MTMIFGTLLLNNDISSVFFIFLKMSFFGLLGVKKVKNSPKWKIITPIVPYLRNSKTYDHDFWYAFVKWYLQRFFLVFLKLSFFGLLGGKRAKNSPKWKIITPVMCHIWRTVKHMILIFGTLVWNNDISMSDFHLI